MPEGRRRLERFSYLMDRNNRCLPDGRKGMQRTGKIKDFMERIRVGVRKVL